MSQIPRNRIEQVGLERHIGHLIDAVELEEHRHELRGRDEEPSSYGFSVQEFLLVLFDKDPALFREVLNDAFSVPPHYHDVCSVLLTELLDKDPSLFREVLACDRGVLFELYDRDPWVLRELANDLSLVREVIVGGGPVLRKLIEDRSLSLELSSFYTSQEDPGSKPIT